MTTIQFYHLTATPLERALPKLLETIRGRDFKVSVVAKSQADVDRLNQLLWTYDPASFMAHGSEKDDNAEQQPVFLTTQLEAPNRAEILLVTNGQQVEDTSAYERVLDMFDGSDEQAVSAARARWSKYKEAGHELSYMQQSEQGSWQQKAAA